MTIQQRFRQAITDFTVENGRKPKRVIAPPELVTELAQALKKELLFRGTWLHGTLSWDGVQIVPGAYTFDIKAVE